MTAATYDLMTGHLWLDVAVGWTAGVIIALWVLPWLMDRIANLTRPKDPT